MKPLRTIFAGTPDFACPSLAALIAHAGITVCAVYTQPDRRAGRGQKITTSPVKQLALAHDLAVRQPLNFAGDDAVQTFRELQADLFVVAAYGLILPTSLLDICASTINVHASLLPRWRGAAPIQRAIMAGDQESGISIMRVVERLDAGPVWLKRTCPIAENETGGTLHDKLATLGAQALHDAVDQIINNEVRETAQDDALSTYAPKITAADRAIDWSTSAGEIERKIRALAPHPGASTRLGPITAKLLSAKVQSDANPGPVGEVLHLDTSGIYVACGKDVLCVTEIQPAGKQSMTAAAFANGYGQQF